MSEPLPFTRKEKATRPCPICGKPATESASPFCSKRCADIDLHKWLGGVYAVPADQPGESDEPEE